MHDDGRTGERMRPRPEWLRALNAVRGNGADPADLVALDEESLVESAKTVTGLDCFGPSDWEQPFRLLVEGLHTTARLHLVGRILARADVLRSLANLLEIEAAYRARPAIGREPIDAPIFVTGLARSGTSILHELLAQDPRLRAPLTYELLYPCVRGSVDERMARADADVTIWNDVTPEYRTMHENRGDAPNECILGTMSTFVSDYWSGGHDVPEYARWLAQADIGIAYRFHRRLLRVLQHGQPARTWTLKAPSHLSTLPALFAEYPDARVVVTHRDPLRVLGSLIDLLVTLRWQRSDSVDVARIVKTNVRAYPYVLDAMITQRADGVIPDDRIVDVRYVDLMRDPWTTLHEAYARLGLDLPADIEDRMRTYLSAKPKDRHGTHTYSFDALGVDRDATYAAFAQYRDRFDVPDEK